MASNYDKLKGPNWIVASVATLFVIGLKLSWEETFPVCGDVFSVTGLEVQQNGGFA